MINNAISMATIEGKKLNSQGGNAFLKILKLNVVL